MKHSQNNRRGRSRGGQGKRSSSPRHVYESNGPDVKVRGTPQQILDKYLTMARDAQSAGDRVLAESYLQFAEHYFRILNADGQNAARQGQNGHGQQGQGGNTQTQTEGADEGAPAVSESSSEEKSVTEVSSDTEGTDDDATDTAAKPKRAPRAKVKAKPKAKPRGRKTAGETAATA